MTFPIVSQMSLGFWTEEQTMEVHHVKLYLLFYDMVIQLLPIPAVWIKQNRLQTEYMTFREINNTASQERYPAAL